MTFYVICSVAKNLRRVIRNYYLSIALELLESSPFASLRVTGGGCAIAISRYKYALPVRCINADNTKNAEWLVLSVPV